MFYKLLASDFTVEPTKHTTVHKEGDFADVQHDIAALINLGHAVVVAEIAHGEWERPFMSFVVDHHGAKRNGGNLKVCSGTLNIVNLSSDVRLNLPESRDVVINFDLFQEVVKTLEMCEGIIPLAFEPGKKLAAHKNKLLQSIKYVRDFDVKTSDRQVTQPTNE